MQMHLKQGNCTAIYPQVQASPGKRLGQSRCASYTLRMRVIILGNDGLIPNGRPPIKMAVPSDYDQTMLLKRARPRCRHGTAGGPG